MKKANADNGTRIECLLFPKAGPQNTEAAVQAGVRRAVELSLPAIVVASCEGGTALAVAREAADAGYAGRLVAVTHHVGFSAPNEDDMGPEMRGRLAAAGFVLVTGTHALSGAERSFRKVFSGVYPLEMAASVLRLFSQGVKTCVECAVMAADAGAVRAGDDAVFIAGTGSGADTACVIAPASQNAFLELKVREILCKPR